MAIPCEKCQGAAEPAAQTRTFEYNGQSLHCLTFVSSCTLCGHRWEDEAYEAVNAHHVEQACAVATSRQHTPRELHKCAALMEQGVSASQSR
jgi:hypothetical protein